MNFPTTRYVNDQDVFARVPKINYYHVGTPVYFGENGGIIKKLSWSWKLILRRIEGIKDHNIKRYIEILKENGL